MNFYRSIFLKKTLSGTLAAATITGMLAFTSCASTDSWFKQADSSLPIEVRHSGSGTVMSSRAHETSDRLYVAGSARRHKLSNTSHVDVQLIGPSGEVIAEEQNDINPMHAAPGGGKRFTDSYVVSFPLEIARKATSIRVIYHGNRHISDSLGRAQR